MSDREEHAALAAELRAFADEAAQLAEQLDDPKTENPYLEAQTVVPLENLLMERLIEPLSRSRALRGRHAGWIPLGHDRIDNALVAHTVSRLLTTLADGHHGVAQHDPDSRAASEADHLAAMTGGLLDSVIFIAQNRPQPPDDLMEVVGQVVALLAVAKRHWELD